MSEAAAPGIEPDNAAPANPAEPQAPAEPDKPQGEASWRDSLPEDIKESPTLSKFDTLEGLAKSYVNLERTLGSEKIPVPKEGDEEGLQRAYKALGWPDSPDEYGFKEPDEKPEGLEYNADLDKSLAGVFHKHGLSKAQAAGVRQDIINDILASGAMETLEASKKAQAEQDAAIKQGEEALKQEWGQAYETRGKVAGAAINKFLSPETIAAMDAAGLANNPAIVKDMYNLGVKLAGEKELIGDGAGEVASPADLDSQIADFRQKHSGALFDRAHPDHAQRTKELTALFERRFPEQAA